MDHFFSQNNSLLLFGKVISRPIIMITSSRKKLLKFLIKIPRSNCSSERLIPGSYETVSVFTMGKSAEFYQGRIKAGNDVVLLGRLVNIRGKKKIFKNCDIDLIIKRFMDLGSTYFDVNSRQRIRLKKELEFNLPSPIFPGHHRFEILVIHLLNIKTLNHYRNEVEISGRIIKKDVKESDKKLYFNLKTLRNEQFIKAGLMSDRAKFDQVRVCLCRDKIKQPLDNWREFKEIKVMGRLFNESFINHVYDQKEFALALNRFKKLDPNDLVKIKKVLKKIFNLRPEPIKRYSLIVEGDHLFHY